MVEEVLREGFEELALIIHPLVVTHSLEAGFPVAMVTSQAFPDDFYISFL